MTPEGVTGALQKRKKTEGKGGKSSTRLREGRWKDDDDDDDVMSYRYNEKNGNIAREIQKKYELRTKCEKTGCMKTMKGCIMTTNDRNICVQR